MNPFQIDANITKAHTIHTGFYTSESVFEMSKELIFAKSWQYIGGVHLLKDNNIHPFILLENFLDEPLVLIQNEIGDFRCCSNVCTHRGNLLANESCKSKQLICKYHGRRFDLDGHFKFMPEFELAANFPTQNDNLAQLPVFQLGSLYFTALTKLDPNLFFKDMLERVNFLPILQMEYRKDLSTIYQIKANWALYVENYLEGFHIPFVHNSLNAVVDYGTYSTEIFEYCNLQLGLGKQEDACFDIPSGHQDAGKSVVAYYFWVFPNMMFNFYPWGLSFNYVEPTGLDSCKVSFEVYVWDESKLEKGAGSGLHQVEMEDEAIVENVQKGVKSRFYTQGRFSPTRETGPHHFHQLLAKALESSK